MRRRTSTPGWCGRTSTQAIVRAQFLTQMSADIEPTFVVVHAKVARGAYARWLMTSRIADPARFGEFAISTGSTILEPVRWRSRSISSDWGVDVSR